MILLILILGFLLRLISLNQSLWLDEAIEALAVKNTSLTDLVTKYSLGDFHPPLYHLLLKLWTNFFGFSEIAMRLPSVIFGTGIILCVYLIANKLFESKTAVIAGLFCAINPLLIYYSQEARMYSLTALAVCTAFYFFLEKKWARYFIFLLIALYSDYVPFLILPVFLFLSKDNRKLLLWHLLIILCYLPWFPYLLLQLHIGTSVAGDFPGWKAVVGGFSFSAVPLTFVKFIIGRVSIDNKIIYGLALAPVCLGYIFILLRARAKSVWLWLVIPIAIGFFGSILIPIYSYFRFLFVLPAFIILLARGSENNRYLVFIVTAVSLGCVGIFNLKSDFQREDWRGFVNMVRNNPGYIIIPSLAQSAPIEYYDNNLKIADVNSISLRGNNTVYLVRYVQEIFDSSDSERKEIENAGFVKTEEKSYHGVLVWKYSRI